MRNPGHAEACLTATLSTCSMSFPEDARGACAWMRGRCVSSVSRFEAPSYLNDRAVRHTVSTRRPVGHLRVISSRVVARTASTRHPVVVTCSRHAKTHVRSASMRSRNLRPHLRSQPIVHLLFPLSRRERGSGGEDRCARVKTARVGDQYQDTDTWKEDSRRVNLDNGSFKAGPFAALRASSSLRAG